jgi:FkbM family methyltransferase
MTVTRLRNGMAIEALDVRNADLVYEEIFKNEVYGGHGIMLREGDCVFDVGANIGLFLLHLNQRLAKARVFAFEPIPPIFAVLRANAARHNRLDLRLFNVGLGAGEGTSSFAFFPRSPADSTMCPDDSEARHAQERAVILAVLEGRGPVRLGRLATLGLALLPRFVKRRLADRLRRRLMTSRPVACPVRTLSSVIDEEQVERIDLLKIDVEGAEFDVLAGLRPDHWPRIRQTVLEVHGGAARAQDMVRLLEEHGMHAECASDPLRPHNFMVYARRR